MCPKCGYQFSEEDANTLKKRFHCPGCNRTLGEYVFVSVKPTNEEKLIKLGRTINLAYKKLAKVIIEG